MPQSSEEEIRRAIEAGKFDHLPGKGKPLHWEENPNEDPETALAHHMLKSSGYTLPWIETRRQIEADIETARAGLRQAWHRRQTNTAGRQTITAGRQRAMRDFRDQVAIINRRIFSYNLEVPVESLQRMALDVEKEIQEVLTHQRE